MIKNTTYKDFLLIVFLLMLSYFGVYHSPNMVRTIILIGLVIIFIRSKDNVPWVVFFFLFFSEPATLFSGNNSYFLLLTSTVGIPYSFIVSFAFLYKGIKSKVKHRNRLAFERNLYLFVLLFLFLVGLMQGGLDFKNWFRALRLLPNILLILYLPLIIDLKKDSIRIKKLLYSLTILLFVIQLYEVILGKSFFSEGNFVKAIGGFDLQRNVTGAFFVLFTLIIGLSDLLSRKTKTNKLEIIAVFSAILILINSGTRGWMIATGLMIFGLLVFGNKPKVALISVISTLIIGLFLLFGPSKYINNITGSFNRLSTVSRVIEGDNTAGGTLSRVTERAPRVLNQFKKSPILGYGFSDTMYEYYDGHVGNLSILLISGLFGFTAIYLIIIRILWHIFRCYLFLSKTNIIKYRLISMIIGFLGLMVIHFSSRITVGYRLSPDNMMFLAFWFLFVFYYLDEAKKYETNINKF